MNSFFSALWDGLSPVLSVIGSAEFLYSVLRLSTPILLATMAALISDRAGVTNIAIEGTMLFAALMGVVAARRRKAVGSACWSPSLPECCFRFCWHFSTCGCAQIWC